jgi:hypothetical protein
MKTEQELNVMLREAAGHIDCLSEFICESSARYMAGATQAVVSAGITFAYIHDYLDAYDATDRSAVHTDCASVPK